MLSADGEVVWSWRPDAGVKLAEQFAGDGGKRARSPGRARRKPLKPLRAGMPGDLGGPVVTMLVCFVSSFAREAAGAAGTRHSRRPLLGERFINASGASRREGVKACLKHTAVIASEAKQSISPRNERMDCFVASLLAMT